MKLKIGILILALLAASVLLSWSYHISRTTAELAFEKNPNLRTRKMIFHGARLHPFPVNKRNDIRIGWSLYYTPEDQFADVYVYVSLTGDIYYDNCSLIKKLQ